MGTHPEDCYFKIICDEDQIFYLPKDYVSVSEFKQSLETDMKTQVSYLQVNCSLKQVTNFYRIAKFMAFDLCKNFPFKWNELLDFCLVSSVIGYKIPESNFNYIDSLIYSLSSEIYVNFIDIIIPLPIFAKSIEYLTLMVQEFVSMINEYNILKEKKEWKDQDDEKIYYQAELNRFDYHLKKGTISSEYYNILIKHYNRLKNECLFETDEQDLKDIFNGFRQSSITRMMKNMEDYQKNYEELKKEENYLFSRKEKRKTKD